MKVRNFDMRVAFYQKNTSTPYWFNCDFKMMDPEKSKLISQGKTHYGSFLAAKMVVSVDITSKWLQML